MKKSFVFLFGAAAGVVAGICAQKSGSVDKVAGKIKDSGVIDKFRSKVNKIFDKVS